MLSIAISLALLTTTTTMTGPHGHAAESSVRLAPEAGVVKLAIGYRIADRRLAPVPADNVYADGETVVAWSEAVGTPAGVVKHAWYRDGVEVARHDLTVGKSNRWRSWTRHPVTPGIWEVRVLDAEGRELALTSFLVVDPLVDGNPCDG